MHLRGVSISIFLIALIFGTLMARQMSPALVRFGAVSELGHVLAWTFIRETGPILAAVLVAVAAATEPTPATPQLPGMMLKVPLLTVVAVAGGVLGGYLFAVPISRNATNTVYWSGPWFEASHFFIGAWKALAFAAIVVAVLAARFTRSRGRWTPAVLLVSAEQNRLADVRSID